MLGNGAQPQTDVRHRDLDDAVTGVGVAPVFQPIVSLPTGATVGFEALARWPKQPHLGPQSVFAYAAATDQVTQLDRVCIDLAVDGALRGGLSEGALLGVNSEPASDYTGRADSDILQRGHDKFALLFELTERNLLGNLPTLMRKVEALRADGIAIALDDVGVNPESLALLDIVCPEVIKLAMPLVQARPTAATAKAGAAIMAHRERRGTLIIAEGIETDQHLEQALAWGAALGQGFLFGKPAPLPSEITTAAWSAPTVACGPRGPFQTPFEVIADHPSLRTATKQTLIGISRHLEEQAHSSADTPMLLTACQDRLHFGAPTLARYTALAATSPLVAVFSRGVAAEPSSGVRAVSLSPADPLGAQWIVLILGPHTAAALIARERTDLPATSEADRQFDFVVTHDRTIVTASACALLNRVP